MLAWHNFSHSPSVMLGTEIKLNVVLFRPSSVSRNIVFKSLLTSENLVENIGNFQYVVILMEFAWWSAHSHSRLKACMWSAHFHAMLIFVLPDIVHTVF